MNVGISYTVDFDELPLEVKKLLVETRVLVENGVLDAFESAENSLEDENYFRALKGIENTRKKLFKADLRLQDCHAILTEYQKMLLIREEQSGVSEEQFSLNFEGSDATIDENGTISLEVNNNE
jgi:hypothetical protein